MKKARKESKKASKAARKARKAAAAAAKILTKAMHREARGSKPEHAEEKKKGKKPAVAKAKKTTTKATKRPRLKRAVTAGPPLAVAVRQAEPDTFTMDSSDL